MVICGPTATGKTALALSLAQQFKGELVSADSRQIYKGMDIGTGKDLPSSIHSQPSHQPLTVQFKQITFRLQPYDIKGIPLWLYDVVNPDDEFSVSHYETLALFVIDSVLKREKLPILVGGTGLYIKAVLEGIPTSSIPRNDQLRKQLENRSVEELQKLLQKQSPEVWATMNNSDRHNPRRLIRKLEISSVEKFSTEQLKQKYDSMIVGLTVSSVGRKHYIADRVNQRVERGIVEEIQTLLKQGYSWELPSLHTLGYKEWKNYIVNPSLPNKQQAIEKWIHDELMYSKKQMTWFKKQPNIHWFNIEDANFPAKVKNTVEAWYT